MDTSTARYLDSGYLSEEHPGATVARGRLRSSWLDLVRRLDQHTDVAEIINVYEARTHLSKLLERVEQGEEITIGRGGRPVARLVPVTRRKPKLGTLAGTVVFHPGWDEPMMQDELIGK